MGDLTAHFSISEFPCPCCGRLGPLSELKRLAEALEAYRAALCAHAGRDVPLPILSGFRCPKQNVRVGGADHSKHLLGIAVDTAPDGLTLYEAAMLIPEAPELERGGAGLYISPDGHGHLHLDVRTEGRARWGEMRNDDIRVSISFEQALGIAKEIWESKARLISQEG